MERLPNLRVCVTQFDESLMVAPRERNKRAWLYHARGIPVHVGKRQKARLPYRDADGDENGIRAQSADPLIAAG
jgi:hypothetical protein